MVDQYCCYPSFSCQVENRFNSLTRLRCHIFVTNIPSADDLGLQFETTACTADVGGESVPGQRLADTAVGVSVINLPGNCKNELPAAIVYSPLDDACEPTPAALETTPSGTLAFPSTTVGGESSRSIIIKNVGGDTATNINFTFPIGSFFSLNGAGCQGQSLVWGAECTQNIDFNPTDTTPQSDDVTIEFTDSIGARSITVTMTGTGV